jgi:DNA repair exonuclease SbcCD ATPase subunit
VASSRWAAIANVVGAFEASAERKGSAVDTAKAAEAELARHVAATRTGGPALSRTITHGDVAHVLRETASTMKEVQVRLAALASSAELKRVSRPELMPPSYPDVPCPLCHRTLTVETADRKKSVLDADVVELVAGPLRQHIREVEAELVAASNREGRIKAKLDETRAKLRNNEAERQREINQAGASSTTVFATERSNSPPLRLNLVINCKCQTDDAFATRPSSGSTRSESPRAAKL